jgi:L-asparaginase
MSKCFSQEFPMPHIHIIATGGTIAMAHDKKAGGAVVSVSSAQFLQGLLSQAGPDLPTVTAEDYGPLPSCQFTVEHLWGLRELARERVSERNPFSEIDGIVISHGTDTLEETAYLLDLTVPGDAPIVVTGAMRIASQPGYEGFGNLLAAVRVAADPQARGLGTLVVLNDQIHAARDVTKMHTQALDTFQSPSWGPIGRLEADRILITRRVQREVLETSRLEPRVYLLKAAVGMDAELLRQAVKLGARGVVIETFGGGRVAPWWLPAIEEAVAAGVAVVVTSRCPSGTLGDPYRYEGAFHDLVRLGCLFAHGLNGQKARIKLMAALGAANNVAPAFAALQD